MLAVTIFGAVSGWSQTPGAPSADSVTPAKSSGPAGAFTFQFSDPAGFSDIGMVALDFAAATAGNGDCALLFNSVKSELFLLSEDFSRMYGPLTAGSPTAVQNANCSTSGRSFHVSASGTRLWISVSVAFAQNIAFRSVHASLNSLGSGVWSQDAVLGSFDVTAAGLNTRTLTLTDDLQSIVNAANPGDELVLPNGYWWTGNLTLRNQPLVFDLSGAPLWITIRSDSGAKITTTNAMPAIANDFLNPDPLQRAAHHYRFDGIAVTAERSPSDENRSAIFLSGGLEGVEASLPHDIQFQRVDLQGDNQVSGPAAGFEKEIARGLMVQGVNITFANSSIDDWKSKTMAIGDSEVGGACAQGSFPQLCPMWLEQSTVESKSRIRYLGNAGALGDPLTDIVARVESQVIPAHPDKVFILGGYTDVGFLPPAGQVMANLETVVSELKAANITPILCNLPPSSPVDNWGKQNAALLPLFQQVNAQIAQFAQQSGIAFVDMHSVLADPATGQYRAGYSPDGNHPQFPASKLEAQAAISAAVNLFDPVTPWLPSAEVDGVNLIADPLFMNDPSAWTVAMKKGNVPSQIVFATESASAGRVVTLTNPDPLSASTLQGRAIASGFAPGDTLAFAGKIRSANCESGTMAFSVGLTFTNIAVGTSAIRDNMHAMFRWSADIDDGQWYVELTVPPALNPLLPVTMTPVIEMNSGITDCAGCQPAALSLFEGGIGAVGGTGSVTIGQIGLLNLTALGLR